LIAAAPLGTVSATSTQEEGPVSFSIRTVRRAARFGALIAWLVLSPVLHLAPAQAAGSPPVRLAADVVLSARGPSSVVVTLPRTVEFLREPWQTSEMFRPHVTVSGPSVHGFALVPERRGTNGLSMFGVVLPAASGQRALYDFFGGGPNGSSSTALPAGRYRLVYLGTAPGWVRLRLPGLATGTSRVTAHTPEDLRASVRDPESPFAPPAPVTIMSDTQVLPAPARVLSVVWYRSVGNAFSGGSSCVYEGQPFMGRVLPGCPNGLSLGVNRFGVVLNEASYMWTHAIFPRGEWTLGEELDTAGEIHDVGSLYIWLPD
jgi:hypothetical protein